MKKVTIPAGTILYRSSDNICSYASKISNQKRECSNTGKKGVYFSTYILQSLAIAIEYNRNLELGIFRTKTPMTVYIGKYSFRNIHPEHWKPFSANHNIQENENISHFNSEMEPIIEYNNISITDSLFNLKPNMGELFLTKSEELNNIELLETYKVDVNILKAFLKENFFSKGIRYIPPDDKELYLSSGAIEPFQCNILKNGGRRKTRRKSKRLSHILKFNTRTSPLLQILVNNNR
jgi:hypothetical protein